MHFFSCHEMHSSSVKSRMCDGLVCAALCAAEGGRRAKQVTVLTAVDRAGRNTPPWLQFTAEDAGHDTPSFLQAARARTV